MNRSYASAPTVKLTSGIYALAPTETSRLRCYLWPLAWTFDPNDEKTLREGVTAAVEFLLTAAPRESG